MHPRRMISKPNNRARTIKSAHAMPREQVTT